MAILGTQDEWRRRGGGHEGLGTRVQCQVVGKEGEEEVRVEMGRGEDLIGGVENFVQVDEGLGGGEVGFQRD